MVLESFITNPYARLFIEFALFFLVLRIVFTVAQKTLLKLALKTKTDLDDLIVRRTSTPINILLFFLAFRIVISRDILPEVTYTILSNIVHSFLILIVGYILYVLVDLIILRSLRKASSKSKTKVDDALFSLFHGVLKIASIVVIFLYILSIWGVEILPLLGALGIAGLAVALALQPVLSNIFSGVSVILDKTVNVGDLVYLDQNTKGTISKIGLRSTKIVTFDNEYIIVPNSKLADGIIQNVALPEPKSRVVIPFSVAYGSDIEKVKKIVMKEVKSVKNIVDGPAPMVRFLEMAESSLNFKAYFYVDTYSNRFGAIDETNTKIYNALRKNRIEIPFPQVDVHLKKR